MPIVSIVDASLAPVVVGSPAGTAGPAAFRLTPSVRAGHLPSPTGRPPPLVGGPTGWGSGMKAEVFPGLPERVQASLQPRVLTRRPFARCSAPSLPMYVKRRPPEAECSSPAGRGRFARDRGLDHLLALLRRYFRALPLPIARPPGRTSHPDKTSGVRPPALDGQRVARTATPTACPRTPKCGADWPRRTFAIRRKGPSC